jgi:transcription initiation factor TFIIIB Brf1 subunit/transcription initiation factor TFIIB
MVHGEVCPICNSKNTGDGEMSYTYDDPAKVAATWSCQDCGAIYSVIYKAEKMEIEKFIEEEDEWEPEYEVTL